MGKLNRQAVIDKLVCREADYLVARYGDPEYVEELMEEVVEEFEQMTDEELQAQQEAAR